MHKNSWHIQQSHIYLVPGIFPPSVSLGNWVPKKLATQSVMFEPTALALLDLIRNGMPQAPFQSSWNRFQQKPGWSELILKFEKHCLTLANIANVHRYKVQTRAFLRIPSKGTDWITSLPNARDRNHLGNHPLQRFANHLWAALMEHFVESSIRRKGTDDVSGGSFSPATFSPLSIEWLFYSALNMWALYLETPDPVMLSEMWFYLIIRLFALFNQALNLIRTETASSSSGMVA